MERTTGIEPAFSAWERDAGCLQPRLWARSSWFLVADVRRIGEISYIGSYTDVLEPRHDPGGYKVLCHTVVCACYSTLCVASLDEAAPVSRPAVQK